MNIRPAKATLLIDSSILLEVLGVPYESDNSEEVKDKFDELNASGRVSLIIPLAAVIEVGSHIVKISDPQERDRCAREFEKIINLSVAGAAPWVISDFQFSSEQARKMLSGEGHYYPMGQSLRDRNFEVGDMVIVEEWRAIRSNFPRKHMDVDVWTNDATLRSVVDTLRHNQDSPVVGLIGSHRDGRVGPKRAESSN